MIWIRKFSSSEDFVPPARNIDNDAAEELRQELVDLIFHLVDESYGHLQGIDLYHMISQSLGIPASGNPYGGPRYAVGRDLRRVEWRRIYDLICRLWPEFNRVGLHRLYRDGVNQILSAHGVVWDLGEDGHLRRMLPLAAQNQVAAAIRELSAPQFAPALALFNAARDAYDDVPRRDRDACSNIFDAMESVAKEVSGMPNATFGDVITHLRRTNALHASTIRVLESIYVLRNTTFGHGMVEPFGLSPTEVDFTYLACIGGILLFARMV